MIFTDSLLSFSLSLISHTQYTLSSLPLSLFGCISEEDMTRNTWCLSKIIFDTLGSTYQHKLEPPISSSKVTIMQVLMYLYIVICSFWLMLFSVCNGSKKAEQWIGDNIIVVFTSALLMRPASLLGVNVFAPAFCLKFGRHCRCCDSAAATGEKAKSAKEKSGKSSAPQPENGSRTSGGTSNDGYKTAKIELGTYKATHKKGLFHANSDVGHTSSMDEAGFVDFHTMIEDADTTRISVAISSDDQDTESVLVGTPTKKSQQSVEGAAVREVEMTDMDETN